jgi:hypothetical protein
MKKLYTSLFIAIVFVISFPHKCPAQTYFQKIYQSAPYDQEGEDVVPMPDGGYLIAGYTTNSTINDMDGYVIKTDALGNLVWTKTFGGAKPDFINHILPTADGNYFLIGYSQSYGGGDYDEWLLKIDPSGTLIWSKTYGGYGNDLGRDIIATTDGNYMIVGSSNSPGLGASDANLIKIDPAGAVIWNKLYGGNGHDYGNCTKQCPDGGYILLGQSFSYGAGNGDAYLVKTDANGDTVWTKTFGGSQSDEGVYITANSDDSFTFVIRDSSFAGRDIDIGIVKTDKDGNEIWSKRYGGGLKDTPKMIQPTSDGGYIVAAISRSFGKINPDMWIMKFNSTGDTTWTRFYGGPSNEHCYVVRELPDGTYIATGKTASSGPDVEVMFLKLNSIGTLTIGVDEFATVGNNIQLYPNPAKESFNIDLKGYKTGYVKVRDILGKEIYIRKIDKQENIRILLTDPSPGIYFVTIGDSQKSITKKLLID